MARIFTENDKRDIFVGSNQQISVSSGLQAVLQAAKSAAEAQQGEMLYSSARGVPTEKVIWSGNPNLQQFEFFVRKAISQVSGVTDIPEFDAEILTDVVSYSAVIKTIYGEGSISGSL